MKSAIELFASRFAPPALENGGAVSVSSLTGSADAFLALALAGDSKFVLAVTPGLPDADRLADDLGILAANPAPGAKRKAPLPVRILEFPPLLDGDRNALGVRLKTVSVPCALHASSERVRPRAFARVGQGALRRRVREARRDGLRPRADG